MRAAVAATKRAKKVKTEVTMTAAMMVEVRDARAEVAREVMVKLVGLYEISPGVPAVNYRHGGDGRGVDGVDGNGVGGAEAHHCLSPRAQGHVIVW